MFHCSFICRQILCSHATCPYLKDRPFLDVPHAFVNSLDGLISRERYRGISSTAREVRQCLSDT